MGQILLRPRRWLRAFLAVPCALSAAQAGAESAGPPSAGPPDIWTMIPREAVAGVVVRDAASFREAMRSDPLLRPFTRDLSGQDLDEERIRVLLEGLPVSENDTLSFLWDRAIPKVAPALRTVLREGPEPLHATAEEILRAFDGPVAVYTMNYEPQVRQGRIRATWDTILCARMEPGAEDRAGQFLDRVVDRVPEDASWQRYNASGAEVVQAGYTEAYWGPMPGSTGGPGRPGFTETGMMYLEHALVDGHLVISKGGRGVLQGVLRRMRGNEADGAATFAGLHNPPADATFFFNQARYYLPRRGVAGRSIAGAWATILGITDAGPLLTSVSIRPGRLSFRAYQGGVEQGRGLLGLLAEMPDNEFGELRRILPAAAGFATVSFNLRDLYEGYRSAMTRIDPAQQFTVDSLIRIVQTLLDVDIQDDLLAYYEGEMVSYVRPPAAEDEPGHALFFFPAREGTDLTQVFDRLLAGLSGERVSFFELVREEHQGVNIWRTPPVEGTRPYRDMLAMAAVPDGIYISDRAEEIARLANLSRDPGAAAPGGAFPPRVIELLSEHRRSGVKGFGYVAGAAAEAEFAARLGIAGQPDGVRHRLEHLWWVAEATSDSVQFTFTVESEVAPAP